jgi:hypothetical protein
VILLRERLGGEALDLLAGSADGEPLQDVAGGILDACDDRFLVDIQADEAYHVVTSKRGSECEDSRSCWPCGRLAGA